MRAELFLMIKMLLDLECLPGREVISGHRLGMGGRSLEEARPPGASEQSTFVSVGSELP